MVRIKHRYLLVNILYPGCSSGLVKTAPSSTVPDVVQIHAPTPDKLTASILAKMIREGVGEIFGEWGLGVIVGGLKGSYALRTTPFYLSVHPGIPLIMFKRANRLIVT